MILALRTDKSQTEIYLLDQNGKIQQQKIWNSGRELARDLPGEIDDLLGGDYDQLTGVVAFKGPGSFTGLRIGLNVANAISYVQNIPVVAINGDDWLQNGVTKLNDGQNDKIALPEYGAKPHITPPKH